MAIALHPSRSTSQTAVAVCWGRVSAIAAAVVFDVALVWSVARVFA